MNFYYLYIDPGTGSLIAQALIAGLAAFFMFFRNGFKGFIGFFKKDPEEKGKKD